MSPATLAFLMCILSKCPRAASHTAMVGCGTQLGSIAGMHRRLLVVILALCVWLTGAASADNYFTTRAPHAVILDGDTGNVLFAHKADVPIRPASMSKIMTAAVVLDLVDKGEITMDTRFKVSRKAWRTGGSKMFVLVDTEIRVEDLLRGLLAVSGNDAAIVLAENISGSEEAFAELMNERAKAWGLTQSTFANPTGREDENQRMSVLDLAKLARLIWQRFPEHWTLFSIETFTWSDIEQKNRNPLLASFDGADGMKTGYTEEAGFGLVGSATRDGTRRFIVVAGFEKAPERAREANRLMRLAFSEFDRRTYFEAGDIVGAADVFGGQQPAVPLRIEVPVRFTLHRRELDGAEAKIIYQGPLMAPVREGEQVAVLQLSMPGQETREYPLYTAESVRPLGVMAKMGIGLRLLFTPPTEPVFD